MIVVRITVRCDRCGVIVNLDWPDEIKGVDQAVDFIKIGLRGSGWDVEGYRHTCGSCRSDIVKFEYTPPLKPRRRWWTRHA